MKNKLDIGGQNVYLNVPDGAVVTGVVIVTSFQSMKEDGTVMAGSTWSTSAIPLAHSVGMMRIASLEMESQAVHT